MLAKNRFAARWASFGGRGRCIRRAAGASLALCLTLAHAHGLAAQDGFASWVALFDPDQVGWLENENRLDELCRDAADLAACHQTMLSPAVRVVSLHVAPDVTSSRLGELIVIAVPGRGLSAVFRGDRGDSTVPLRPDLEFQDWGYGPLFHQTFAERRGEWYRLPGGPWEGSAWALLPDDAAQARVLSLAPDEIIEIAGRGMVVVAVEADALLLRREQPADHWCDEASPPPRIADEPVRVARTDLVDDRGHLLIGLRYLKGC